MALSPNYGFPEPDNSSLVKNGAQDIRALGDAVDTAVWNVGFGQAGKNKYLNGDFTINQRAFTSVANPSAGLYTFDRWKVESVDGTSTYSAQTFTAGAAPVAGYEATNYFRIVTTGQTLTSAQTQFAQLIENVRNLAGNSATVSFWAKANTGTPKIALEFRQNFGSGGSATVSTPVGAVTIGTTWQRYSLTATVPSISGKTLGANSFLSNTFFVSAGSDFNTRASSIGIQSNTFDIWGFQIEYGSKATPFQTATGTIQGELAACQRYYFRGDQRWQGFNGSTTTAQRVSVSLPVEQRTNTQTITIISTTLSGFSGLTAEAFAAETIVLLPAPSVLGDNKFWIVGYDSSAEL